MSDQILLEEGTFNSRSASSEEDSEISTPRAEPEESDENSGGGSTATAPDDNGDVRVTIREGNRTVPSRPERSMVFTPPGVDLSDTRALPVDGIEMQSLNSSFGSGQAQDAAAIELARRESQFSRMTGLSELSHSGHEQHQGIANSASSSILSRLARSGGADSKSASSKTKREPSGLSILAPRKKGRAGSVAEGGFEGPFDEAFWEKVEEKKTLEGLIKKLAMREARLDRIIEQSGSAEAAVTAILDKSNSQGEARQLLDGLIARGIDLGCRDDPYLHIAAEKNYVYVARTLMDNEAAIDAASEKGELPVIIALQAGHDEMASVILRRMNKKRVRELFDAQKDGNSFRFQNLVSSGDMPLTCRAILDACVQPTDEPDEYRFHYRILESDANGYSPNDAGFNVNGKTAFHRVLECRDKEMQRHNVVRMLIYNKWVEYGERMAILNLSLYLLFMLCVTFSLISAGRQADPRIYDSAEDYARGVLEVISLIGVMFNLYDEIKELHREKLAYLTDGYNYLQVTSMLLLVAIIPLRWTNQDAQWHVACFAYIFLCLRILMLISVTRMVGIYLQILTRILYKDISRFVIIFGIFLLTYSGSLFLALRAEPIVERNSTSDPKETTELSLGHFTSNYGFILLSGLRTMIQQETNVDYINDDEPSESFSWLGIVINMLFLFFVLVVLLNILIAQLSDTYADVKADAQRELEQNWAASLRILEQGTSPLKRYRFKNYDDYEDVVHPGHRLIGWEEPKDVDEDEEEKRRKLQMEADIEKQSQQIMALKAQMRATLELLHENRKVPPKLDHNIAHLGTVQVPETVNNIVMKTEAVLRDDVMETRKQQNTIFNDLSQAAREHTDTLKKSVDDQNRDTQTLMTTSFQTTSTELDHLKQTVGVTLPDTIQSVTAAAHTETIAALSAKLNETSGQLQALEQYIQTNLRESIDTAIKTSELSVIGDATAAVTMVREQESEHNRELREALQVSQQNITDTLCKAVKENCNRLQVDLTQQLERGMAARHQALEQQLSAQVDKMMAEVNRLIDGSF
ncbi:uncharacterized protein LOC135825304 [Sycon ciliatum]|uniref:uncharacterized protein LOC135825304 n=1 Tax=Sycon ciliatum TaxID=27933 RepID=UPI0031F61245